MNAIETDILVIGGGSTGSGVAWDAALRGFRVVLVEKRDLTHGTTGRYHGLLHSGGRYAVKDPQSAVECIEENRILRRTHAHCIEDTGGMFVVTPEDEGDYPDRFKAACLKVGIPCEELPLKEAFRREPMLGLGQVHPDRSAGIGHGDEPVTVGHRGDRGSVAPDAVDRLAVGEAESVDDAVAGADHDPVAHHRRRVEDLAAGAVAPPAGSGREVDRGKRGKVIEVQPAEGRVVVEGRNLRKKHAKPRPVKGTRGAQMTPGGIIDVEVPLRASNVALVCPSCHKPTRVGYEVLKDGSKVRRCKKCGSQIDK